MPFYSGGVNLNDFYFTDADIVDQYLNGLNGALWLWGLNGSPSSSYGRLGDNTGVRKSSPVQTIAGGTNWKQVSCGKVHTAAVKTDGTLWLWGGNGDGRLGDDTTTNKSSPVQTITGGTNWKQVSCGYGHVACVKTDGTLWLWGSSVYGQLGDNTLTSKSSPVQTIAGGTNWKQVSCGIEHTAAIKTDGTLWAWGRGALGRLGGGTSTTQSSPVQTITGGTNWKQVSCGENHTAAVKTDGTLWLWGNNASGRLGDGTSDTKSSPAQTITGGTNWIQVSCGIEHTAAIKTDGTLWLWGSNGYGQLGDGTSALARSSPVQTITGGTNWKQVACGRVHTAAVKTDGTLWLWGSNAYGQLGDNTNTYTSSPIQTITGGTYWKQVSCEQHTAAVQNNG